MPGNSEHDHSATALDPDLLSTPFRVQTNWYVITGSSCSGKTTLTDQLAEKGFRTDPESGRQYFERELAKGRAIEEIREDQAALTCQVYEMMVERERGLRAAEVIFLD